jgi:hypothetical protein
MIGLKDTVVLATTKLRVRRVRLIVTIVTSGLLFSTLAFGSLTVSGLSHGIKAFMSQGLLNRYMVNIQSFNKNPATDPAVVARIEVLEKARIEAKKAEAKRLKIPYDPATEPPATITQSTPDGKKEVWAAPGTPLLKQAVLDIHQPDGFEAGLAEVVAPYHTKALSSGYSLGFVETAEYSLTPVIGNSEIAANLNYANNEVLPRFSSSLQAVDEPVLEPFILPQASLESKPGEPIPLILPIDAVETILGKTKLPKTATPAEQLAYIRSLRTAALNAAVNVCYRNAEAIKLGETAKQQSADRTTNAKTSGWQPPALEYQVPTGACQPVAVSRDARTAAIKAADAKQEQFDQKFGKQPAVTAPIAFKIVGILPRTFSPSDVNDPLGLASSFLTSSLNTGAYIPKKAMLANPYLSQRFSDALLTGNWGLNYFVEFPDRASQKDFIDKHSCNGGGGDPNKPEADPFAECRTNHQYLASPVGNPLASMSDIAQQGRTALNVVIAVLATMSGLIMMGTIGKIIADSRKETSVFRAVGAKRRDIAQIYMLFSVLLAVGGFVVAVIIGLAGALYVDHISAPSLTAQALLAFNSSDLNKVFHVVYFNAPDFLKLAIFVVGVGLAGAAVPLAGNLQRSPIKDMRED